ncbi:MAG: 3-phosphoshikimate 1-carboxyvinyltransferase [Minwuiales bacterium]|nr:3-phosphoshikimate 1-carboxyvinyltransferase [Minwuiales bacterium]
MKPLRPGSLTSRPTNGLAGTVRVPGDKSISHRALILATLAVGESTVSGLLEGDDVLCTAEALRQLGAEIERGDGGVWRVAGVGVGGLREAGDVLDCGNSGTGVRLLMGLVAGHPITTFLTGDESLRGRPMNRVATPLRDIGARIVGREGGRLPLAVCGAAAPMPIEYRLPVASAQVKSAVLLAGLTAPGETRVIEPRPTRDHTERMLRHFGAAVAVDDNGERTVSLVGQPELQARHVEVPGDPSSAAFPIVAAAIGAESDLTVEAVGVNVLRAGLFDCLKEMGAAISLSGTRELNGEPIADIAVRPAALRGIAVPPERAPSMIDEYPILCAAAAFAEGPTEMRGIGEMRVKESDRIAAMAAGLTACGVEVEEFEDGLVVHGRGGEPPAGGALVATEMDHRIAMSFLALGTATKQPVTVDSGDMIATSFPGFVDLMNRLGADIGAPGP